WSQALTGTFDAAIAVHHSGELHRISAPLAVLSHGIGFSKIVRHRDERRATSDERRATSDERRATSDDVYGLGRRWLYREGTVPAAVIVPHDSDL
ncbi:hypothetical protein, partial [Nocardia farcinica]|uniref:hypothetical protein n=1 Tax=Nocardia farcinica TaxID=37329 RepID=UPI0034DB3A25